jgi:hypothetical protein
VPYKTELKLVVPATVHPDIFAWGAECLRFSVTKEHPDVITNILDLRESAEFMSLWIELRATFERDVSNAMQSVYRHARCAEPEGNMGNERSYHYLAAWLMIACERREVPPRFAALAHLARRRGDAARNLVARIDAVLKTLLQPELDSELIVGISSLQYILLDSIFLAHRAKAVLPRARIILGGDPLDIPTAREVLMNAWIDGCVTGPGEYALNEIVEAVKSGIDVRNTPICRLVNRAFLVNPEANLKAWNATIEARADYDAVVGYHGVQWNERSNIIHILGRRGCTWAACTFCHRSHVVTKEHVFDPSMTLMQREIDRIIDNYEKRRQDPSPHASEPSRSLYRPTRYSPLRSRSEALYIRWDADDAELAMTIKLISWLTKRLESRPSNGRDASPLDKVVFYSFAPARQLSRPYAHALARAFDPKRMQVRLGVAIETLNPKAARTMKKGVNPIDAIKAMKVAADSGAVYAGIYFAFYPLETLRDVAVECEYLNRSLHLLVERYVPHVYIGSHRDSIGKDPAAYNIVLNMASDPLMAMLGMNTRQDSTRRYTIAGETSLARLQNAYVTLFWSLKAWMTESTSRRRIRALLRTTRAALAFLMWTLAIGNFAYVRRLALIYACAVLPPNKVRLYLRGGEVVRERPWYLGGAWRKSLSKPELRMLRFLYERRRQSEVQAKFADVAEAQRVVDGLKELGLVVQHNDLLISVVNDPLGLREALRQENLEELQRMQDVPDDGLGVVRTARKPRANIDALSSAASGANPPGAVA